MILMFQPLRKYADFSGRARRAEYWLFMLFQCLLYSVILGLTFVGLGGKTGAAILLNLLGAFSFIGLAALVLFVPNLAVLTRRLHDIGLSIWWLCLLLPGVISQFTSMSAGVTLVSALAQSGGSVDAAMASAAPTLNGSLAVSLIAGLCNLAVLVMTLWPGKRGSNRFGPDPKGNQNIDISVFDEDRIDAAIAEAKKETQRDPEYKPVFDFTSPQPATRQSEPPAPHPVHAPARQTPAFGKRR